MKTFKTALAVITAALLAMALLASPSSADIGVDDKDPTGVLKLVSQIDNSVAVNPPYETGQAVRLYANFNGGVRNVTFYKVVGGTQTTIGTDEANTNGNAYLNYTISAGAQDIYAEDVNDEETETDTITGEDAPPPGAVLDLPNDSFGKSWTAHFTPTVKDQATRLELRRICTYETDETNPAPPAVFDPEQSQKNCIGPWKSIATGKQDVNGDTTFSLPDKFEVEHQYRAVSGTTISNEQKFAPALVEDNPYGITTDLSEVHFNTYEQASVNTRDHYFEGEFTMTPSTKAVDPDGNGPAAAATCGAVAPIKKSVLKGRGNYSWSFPKKSFTLKIDKKTSLCGMGVSKKYALVANDYDKSLLRNSLAGYVGSTLDGLAWTPKSTPVDFYMNGSYRGSYLLIERIALQGSVTNAYKEPDDTYSNRVNIDALKAGDDQDVNGLASDEGGFTPPAYNPGQDTNASHPNNQQPRITGGYILEWDFRKGADYNAYLGSDSGYVGVKEPENDVDREGDPTGAGISSQQKSYISGFLNKVDNSLRAGPSWQTYIDKESAVDYYIAMEYMKPVDGNMWASVYMYKPRGEEKLYFGPLWDFDLAAGSANRAGNVVSSSGFYLKNNLGVSAQQDTSSGKTWFNRLNEYPSFRTAVAERWDEIKGDLQTTTYLNTQSSLIAKSAQANFNKWSSTSRISDVQVLKGSWTKDWEYLRTWASGRKTWLDGGSGF